QKGETLAHREKDAAERRSVKDHDRLHQWRCVFFFPRIDTQAKPAVYFRNAVRHANKTTCAGEHGQFLLQPGFVDRASRLARYSSQAFPSMANFNKSDTL